MWEFCLDHVNGTEMSICEMTVLYENEYVGTHIYHLFNSNHTSY